MAKIDVDSLKQILQRNNIDIRKVSEIIQDVTTEIEIQAAERENRPPPVKKQFVILVSDPEGNLGGKDYTGWVVQIPEEDSPYTAPERLIRSAYEYNTTPKGQRLPIQSIGETCEVVPTRISKEEQVWIKTKEPILVVTTDNVVPKPTGDE
jgi:hypothetical protein